MCAIALPKNSERWKISPSPDLLIWPGHVHGDHQFGAQLSVADHQEKQVEFRPKEDTATNGDDSGSKLNQTRAAQHIIAADSALTY